MDYLDRIHWTPTIGDPTLMGWLTVIAYGITALVAFRVANKSRFLFDDQPHRLKRLWLAIGIGFCFLALNKQLDLQSFFTQTMKYFAQEQGWYHQRRLYQQYFIWSVLIMASVTLVALLLIYQKHVKSHFLGLLGLTLVMSFILIRASSFHKVDILLGIGISYFKLNHLLELTGIALVITNAQILLRKFKSDRPSHFSIPHPPQS